MSHYNDLPDTHVYYSPIPAGSDPGISSTRCGCVLPNSCDDCDGTSAERREMWAMPRRDRIALELANRRLDPHWRELHGLDATGGAA